MGKDPLTYTNAYQSAFRRLSAQDQDAVRETVQFFLDSPYHPTLRHHTLRETPDQIWSLSAGDDLRILLRVRGDSTIILLDVGTHAEIYG